MEIEINNTLKKKYFIEKYLGIKNNNKNYLASNNGEKYLIQVHPINKLNNDSLSQIAFINYLSRYQSSRKYIRPCLDFGISKNNLIMVHQYNEEKTLGEYLNKIKDLSANKYLDIITKIIIKILFSLVYIHRKGVVHQNLDFENILIKSESSDNDNIKYISVIFSNFQYSCGHYLSDQDKKIHSQICPTKLSPLEDDYKEQLIERIKKVLKDEKSKGSNMELAYLYLAKKYDIWLLGILFWKMINRPSIGFNPTLVEFNYKDMSYNGIDHNESKKLSEFVVKNMLSKIPNRLKAKEILDDLLLKFKYGL